MHIQGTGTSQKKTFLRNPLEKYHKKEFLENLTIKVNLSNYIPKLKDQTVIYQLHQLGYNI